MDFFTTVGFASSALSLAEQGKNIKSFLKKLGKWILDGNCNIILFGAGGTGKTTISKTLSGIQIDDFSYHETPVIEKIGLDGDVWGNYLVAPGQERRADRYWPDLFRKLGSGKAVGIINVVSFGFHSLEIGNASFKTTNYFKGDDSDFLTDYISERKEVELRLLRKVCDHIKTTPNKVWMITLVNKQDLWWDIRDEVRDFYLKGDYQKMINEIYDSKGRSNFIHESVSAAMFSSNFNIGNDFSKNTVAGYDEPLRLKNYNNFIELLKGLINV